MYLTPNNNKHFYDNLLQPFRTINSINKEYVFLWPVKNYHQTPPKHFPENEQNTNISCTDQFGAHFYSESNLFLTYHPPTTTIHKYNLRHIFTERVQIWIEENKPIHTHTLKSNKNSEISKIFFKPLIKHRHFNQIRFMF